MTGFPTPAATVWLQWTNTDKRVFGIATGPGVVNPLIDNAGDTPPEICVQLVEQISGSWGLIGGSAGAEIMIGIGLSTLGGGSVGAWMTSKTGLVAVANEYFSTTVYPASTTSPPPPAPPPGITTDAQAQAAIGAAIAKLTVVAGTPPVFSLATGAVTD